MAVVTGEFAPNGGLDFSPARNVGRELEGGRIAQIGSPADILAHPANDFVASFIGADRGKRALHVERHDGRDVLVDSDGRLAGVLVGDSAPGQVEVSR